MIFYGFYAAKGGTKPKMVIFLGRKIYYDLFYCKTRIKAKLIIYAGIKCELFYTSYWTWEDNACKISRFNVA
jgi:hypothetical protein